MSTLILIFASALLFAVSATPEPAARKVHTTPIPRLGGIAMYGAVVIALLVFRERFGLNQLVSILLGATWVSLLCPGAIPIIRGS
jgi:UDP-GlcNAc:undecaprenyl-phosphate GlcNAc-1-phosphate transferase